ncbi:Phosphatidylserine decarboxylase proenzyme [uncultured archaeon]|nr:Phosphatidylserine decarboxylase proenzyme [uncultured archaeon]
MCLNRVAVFAIKIFPKELASRIMGAISDKGLPKIILIPWIKSYCKIFGVDMSESEKSVREFNTFNEFFIRELKAGVRNIDSSKKSIISPVDGTITEFGKIEKDIFMQAKGKTYSLESLLQNHGTAKKFEGGSFATIYLSPKDYHRIHSPVSGKIAGYSYIPGSLFPVGNFSSVNIGGLFLKNERLITYMEYPKGNLAIVKIGACTVGRIRTSYENRVFDTSMKTKIEKKYAKKIPVKKGEEIGRFELGSTVVLLFKRSSINFEKISKGDRIRMGERIASITD